MRERWARPAKSSHAAGLVTLQRERKKIVERLFFNKSVTVE
jgi:hypothetical protein